MSTPENQMHGGDILPEYAVEFRAFEDDAWYSIKLFPERDDALRIKYLQLSDKYDFVFYARNIKGLKELEDFEGRFRNASAQLQDNECRSLVEGMKVCACHWFSNDDIRFYDALVKEVHENQHSFEKGEEVCSCTFSLLWLHGPIAGKLYTTTIENVCKIQPTLKLDPVVASFLKTARDRFEVSSKSNLISKGITGWEVVPYSDDSSNSGRRLGFFERLRKETRCARRSINKVSPSLEKIVSSHDRIQKDRELAVERNQYLILVGNLDIALSPPTIIEFLRRQTSVLPRVYVYPCLRSEPYTRGAIVLDCERDFQKLGDFVTNPNHIIISSTGRPWVIIEKIVGLKNIKASIGTLMPITENILQNGNSGGSNKLKVVSSGTKNFEIANHLRNLFLDFSAHQERLHKRLAFEEARIYCS